MFIILIFVDNFIVQGIDIKTFTLLTGEDLLELGINTFGARKRLLLAINQLKNENPSINEWHLISECKDIPSLLTQLNLERYIGKAKHISILQLIPAT